MANGELRLPKQYALFGQGDLAGGGQDQGQSWMDPIYEYIPQVQDPTPQFQARTETPLAQAMGSPFPGGSMPMPGGMGGGIPMLGGMAGGGMPPGGDMGGGMGAPGMAPPMPVEVPPGQAGLSQGPIARMKQMYQQDPTRFMMMMSALAGSALNPGLPLQLGMEFQNQDVQHQQYGQQDAYRQEGRDIQRQNQANLQQQRQDTFVDRLYNNINRDNAPLQDLLPPGANEITADNRPEVQRNFNRWKVEEAGKKKRRSAVVDVYKGLYDGNDTIPDYVLDDPEAAREFQAAKAWRKRATDIDMQIKDARKKVLEAHSNETDPSKKADIKLLYDQLNEMQQRRAALDRAIRSQEATFDIAGVTTAWQDDLESVEASIADITYAIDQVSKGKTFAVTNPRATGGGKAQPNQDAQQQVDELIELMKTGEAAGAAGHEQGHR